MLDTLLRTTASARSRASHAPHALAVALLFSCFVPARGGAQSQPDPFATARHRSGPLAINPSLSIVDAGVDSNVFNDVANPKQDVTTAFRPAADIWLRAGRARLTAKTQLSYNYFKQYASERYVGTDNRLRFELRGPRVTPFGTVSFLSTRDRISPEVDARVRRDEWTAGLGADVELGGRVTARLSGRHFEDQVDRLRGKGPNVKRSVHILHDRSTHSCVRFLSYELPVDPMSKLPTTEY